MTDLVGNLTEWEMHPDGGSRMAGPMLVSTGTEHADHLDNLRRRESALDKALSAFYASTEPLKRQPTDAESATYYTLLDIWADTKDEIRELEGC